MVGWETGYRDEEAVCPRGRGPSRRRVEHCPRRLAIGRRRRAGLVQFRRRVRVPTLHAVDLSQVEMRLIEPRIDLERLAIPLERGVVVAIEEADARGHV